MLFPKIRRFFPLCRGGEDDADCPILANDGRSLINYGAGTSKDVKIDISNKKKIDHMYANNVEVDDHFEVPSVTSIGQEMIRLDQSSNTNDSFLK